MSQSSSAVTCRSRNRPRESSIPTLSPLTLRTVPSRINGTRAHDYLPTPPRYLERIIEAAGGGGADNVRECSFSRLYDRARSTQMDRGWSRAYDKRRTRDDKERGRERESGRNEELNASFRPFGVADPMWNQFA